MAPFLLCVLLLVVAGAAVPRVVKLGNRPMHCDEAVHAIKFGQLLEDDYYVYNPDEYHGPSLNFLTLPIACLASADRLTEITETHLRLLPAIFGIAIVGAVWLLRNELGYGATLYAAALTAASPAMVFYSRYYIQEMLLVAFTFGAIVAIWRCVRAEAAPETCSRFKKSVMPILWVVVAGVCIGMMHASKETCVIHLFAMAVAIGTLVVARRIRRPLPISQTEHEQIAADAWFPIELTPKRIAISVAVMAAAALITSAIFFSSFLDNPRGVVDSFTTYSNYLDRASGEGGHEKDWHYYFRVLFWWHRGDFVLSEAPIAPLAVVGLVAAVAGRGAKPGHLPMTRFLAIYTIVMAGVYSVLPYKTPWCALGLLHGTILLAGVGAAVLVRVTPTYAGKALMVVLLAGAVGVLGYQAHRASFVAYNDPGNPHVYAQTADDVAQLAKRVREIAAVHQDGQNMHIQVICADNDFWPLPWYLRDFPEAKCIAEVPHGEAAPLIITQPTMSDAVVDFAFWKQPPGQRHLLRDLPRGKGLDWHLRPHVPLEVFIRHTLLEKYEAKCSPASWDSEDAPIQ